MMQHVEDLLDGKVNFADSLPTTEDLPDFRPLLKRELFERAATLSDSQTNLDLIFETVKRDTRVHLGPFELLPISAMCDLVSRLASTGSMTELDFSGHPEFSLGELDAITRCAGQLKRVLIMDTALLVQELESLGTNIEVVNLHEVLRRPFVDKRVRSTDIGDSGGYLPLPSPKFSSNHSVVQLAWIAVPSLFFVDTRDPSVKEVSALCCLI